jgi:hypothetical protein
MPCARIVCGPLLDKRHTDAPRLALSHNLLASLPSRLIECKRLRYLNVRYNAMREFPEAVCPPSPIPTA